MGKYPSRPKRLSGQLGPGPWGYFGDSNARSAGRLAGQILFEPVDMVVAVDNARLPDHRPGAAGWSRCPRPPFRRARGAAASGTRPRVAGSRRSMLRLEKKAPAWPVASQGRPGVRDI